MNTPQLETDRLVLRRLAPEDMGPLTEFYLSERSRYAGHQSLRAKAWTNAAAMLAHWDIRGYGNFAITVRGDDACVGLSGPYFPDGRPEKEVGWVLFDGQEGKGFATEAARATVAYAFQTLGWDTVVSYIAKPNARSVAVAKRLGAELDPNAPQPNPDEPCFVYRHPRPEAA